MMRFCVIGYPVEHSLSPRIHNRAFKSLKIDAHYEAISVHPRELGSFIRRFRKNFTGANVTIPHKERVIKFLDALSLEARAIGAVNTIVNRGGKLVGYNTDVYGAISALRKVKGQRSKVKIAIQNSKVSFLKDARVIVLGAGGAARAIIFGFKKAGAKIIILNRTLSHAKKLAKKFGCKCGRLTDFGKKPFDLLINTTSVGMIKKVKSARLVGASTTKLKVKKAETPFKNLSAILEGMQEKPTVMDIVYTPRMTKFLRDAKRAGCKIITGDKMFLAQAEKSFELWTGTRPKFMKL